MRDSAFATFTRNRLPFVTKFIIDASDCVIYLSPSYCAEGYNSFTVDMTTQKATIYDRRGNIIFNPTNYQNGVYRFTAIVDPTIDDVYKSAQSLDPYVYPINSGYCDVWEIEKIS